MQDFHKNIAEYNSGKKIIFDDMIIDMISNKNLIQQ